MITMIAAVDKNNAIGNDNNLLCCIPEDMKRFKNITTGHTIIMGRKTFESLHGILKNRTHVVITKNKLFKVRDKNVIVVHSIEDVLSMLKEDEEYFIIGGESIYRQFMPYAEKMHITFINYEFEADTFFPSIDYKDWIVRESIDGKVDNNTMFYYKFVTLKRKHN